MSLIHRPERNEKRSQERLRLTTYRLRVFLWPEDGECLERYDGFSFVSDFSFGGVGLYLATKIAVGESVRVAFDSPEGPTFKAIVAWENRISYRQQFLGHDSLSHRLGLKFQFGTEAERQRYLEYFEQLKARVLQIAPGMNF
jgi:hypothetical protein